VSLAEEFRLGADGRLVRDSVPLEVNPYCRRAIAQAPTSAIRELACTRDAGSAPLTRADGVLAAGAGGPLEEYGELSRPRELLGAELVGTRKVTDQG
jgi:hypothetical protein